MIVEFQVSKVYNNELDIKDIGQASICCTNPEWGTWYLIIRTIRGKSHVLEYGPVFPDTESFGLNFEMKYYSMKFNEKKLYLLISNFLNDKNKEIDSASECDSDIVYDDFPNVIKLYKNIE